MVSSVGIATDVMCLDQIAPPDMDMLSSFAQTDLGRAWNPLVRDLALLDVKEVCQSKRHQLIDQELGSGDLVHHFEMSTTHPRVSYDLTRAQVEMVLDFVALEGVSHSVKLAEQVVMMPC
jgi:hypothetical protein